MRQAVRAAFSFAKKGDIILLSPAAASFGMFKNEFDRGRQFIRFSARTRHIF
jgi:UDP-N-acetylmuramoylalanine--D-glutamate ligase